MGRHLLVILRQPPSTLEFQGACCGWQVAKLQRACLMNPVKLEVDAKYRTVDTLRQQYLFIPAKHKVWGAWHAMH